MEKLLQSGKPGPIRRATHNNKKASTLKIPIPWRKSRKGVSCSEERSHFYFHFLFCFTGLLKHAQHMSDTIAHPFNPFY